MPFRFPFSFPPSYPFRPSYNNYKQYQIKKQPISIKSYNEQTSKKNTDQSNKKDTDDNFSISFFEIFGIKLYFDDILIICLLFFLYTERVQDDELFVCLILLLLA